MWNFEYLDTLTQTALRRARVFGVPRGKGPTLLFVHGGFHGAWCWTPFLKFFDDNNVSCSAIDLRGHGGQPQTDTFVKQGIAQMAEDVGEAAATIGNDVVLIAHSAGTLAALSAAQSLKPRGLVLIAPGAPANVAFKKTTLPAFADDQPIAVPNEERVRKWFLQGIANDVDIAPLMNRLCPESPAFMNDCFAHGFEVRQKPQCPILCLSGGRDHSPLHARGQDQAVSAFLDAEIEITPDAGHSLMIEPLWRTGAVAILNWLRRTGIVPV